LAKPSVGLEPSTPSLLFGEEAGSEGNADHEAPETERIELA
jgi:hypothetical protein